MWRITLFGGPLDGYEIASPAYPLSPLCVLTSRPDHVAVYRAGGLLSEAREGPVAVRAEFLGWTKVGQFASVRISE